MSDEEVALLQDQLNEARAEVERLQMAAADSEARASHLNDVNREMRGRLETVEGEFAEAQAAVTATQQESQELQARLQTAAGKYREALLACAPDLPEEMLAGDSIEELEASAKKARQTVRHVRDRLESQAQAGRVPAGAPPRGAPDFSALSSIEKIRLGLNNPA